MPINAYNWIKKEYLYIIKYYSVIKNDKFEKFSLHEKTIGTLKYISKPFIGPS